MCLCLKMCMNVFAFRNVYECVCVYEGVSMCLCLGRCMNVFVFMNVFECVCI